jgi:dienelactone hydrolase
MNTHSLDSLPDLPLDVRWISRPSHDGIIVSELTFQAYEDQVRAAYFVCPEGEGPFPVILYVHWYEPQACDSNRTQFLGEAKIMAERGCMSLLIETMWSDREWFLKRTQADDVASSIQQTIELRRAMDLLLAQPGAHSSRFAYVGHDFGAMYGVVAGSVDKRPTCYVLMAGTPRFPDWYLYYPKLEGEERVDFIEQMKFLDPIERVGQLSPAPILFQFGSNDVHVPIERANEFADAAETAVQMITYDAGHGLDAHAMRDRMSWLGKQLFE